MHKIAHIVRRFVFEEWGGIETVVWNTAKQQLAQGLQPEILATAALGKPGVEERDGIVIRRFPYTYPYFPLSAENKRALDKKGGNPYAPELLRAVLDGHFDVCHFYCGGRLAAMTADTVRKRRRIPCVISLQGGAVGIPEQEMQQLLRPVRHKLHYGGILDRLLRRPLDPLLPMDALLAMNRTETETLQKQFPDKFVGYCPNGITAERFTQPDTVDIRTEFGIPENRRIILCISRIDYQKNQRAIIPLIRETPDTHLLLIGPVTVPWYAEEIQKDVQTAGIADRFTLIPGLRNDDPRLPAALHAADTFILPSIHEPFGIVALEAQAAGVPVIAAKVGGLQDFVRNEHNGLLIHPQQPETILNAWKKLQNPTLRQTLIQNAQQDAKEYEWEIIVKQLTKMYTIAAERLAKTM